MSYELLYTSAPSGLKRGSRGFATVLCTQGTPANIASRLETLSGYRHIYSPGDPRASLNPVAWSHVRISFGRRTLSVLSRIADYGVDYSGRTNKLAHHLVLEPDELSAAGPAWLLAQTDIMRTDWDGQTVAVPAGPSIPSGDQSPAICEHWKRMTGDAGWGGRVAEWLVDNSSQPAWIIFSPQQSHDLLGLLSESIALLPVAQRWRATFSTYYTSLPPEVNCKVRCVLAGSDEARLAVSRGRSIHLTGQLPPPPESSWVTRARTGQGELPSPAESLPDETAQPLEFGSALAEWELESHSPPESPPDSPPEMPEPASRPSGFPPAFPPGGGPPQLPTVDARKKARRAKPRFGMNTFLIVAAILLLTVTLGLTAGFVVLQGMAIWERSAEIADAAGMGEEEPPALFSESPQNVDPARVIDESQLGTPEKDEQRPVASENDEPANDNETIPDREKTESPAEAKLGADAETGADDAEPVDLAEESNGNNDEKEEEQPRPDQEGEALEGAVAPPDSDPQSAETTGERGFVAYVQLPIAKQQKKSRQVEAIEAHFAVKRDSSRVPKRYQWEVNKSLISSTHSSGDPPIDNDLSSGEWTWKRQYPRHVDITLKGTANSHELVGTIRVLDWSKFGNPKVKKAGELFLAIDSALSTLLEEPALSVLSGDAFNLEIDGDNMGCVVNAQKLLQELEKRERQIKDSMQPGTQQGLGTQDSSEQSDRLLEVQRYIQELKKLQDQIVQMKNMTNDIEFDCGILTLNPGSTNEGGKEEKIPLKFRLQLNIEDR